MKEETHRHDPPEEYLVHCKSGPSSLTDHHGHRHTAGNRAQFGPLRSSARCAAALLALVLARPAPIFPQDHRIEPHLDTNLLKSTTFFLSHDLLRGRKTPSREADLVAAYLESSCRSLGLAPVGKSFLQRLDLSLATWQPSRSSLVLRTSDDRLSAGGSEFAARFWDPRKAGGFAGPIRYIGTEEDILQNEQLDLEGSVALALGPIVRRVAVERVVGAGAAGLIQLSADSTLFQLAHATALEDAAALADPAIPSSYFVPLNSILAGPALSRRLVRLLGLGAAIRPPQNLPGEVSVQLTVERHRATTNNVLCLLAGEHPTKRDSALVLAAHYDHLGTRGVTSADSIYNGFSDNSAGVAMTLAVADALSRGEPLDYSVLFFFSAGEERGLLGSDYFVEHPVWPLDRLLGMINLDAGAPPAPPISWELAANNSGRLIEAARSVSAERGWRSRVTHPRPNSDYYPFFRVGVPALFPIPGPGPYQGLSAEMSDSLRQRWDHYHEPSDEWSPEFPWSGLVRYADFARAVILKLSQSGVGD